MQGVQPMQLTAEQQQQQYQQYQQMQQQQQLQQQQYQQQYQQYQQQQQQQQQQQMQPQQYQQYQQQQQPQQQGSQGPLSVAGCADPTVGNIVRGTFNLMTENHGRPVYKKSEVVANNPTLDVLIYFWDERDGANFCGWWFGPKVGGDQVWAYNSGRSATPPSTGWRVPYDGSVDPSFVISGGQGGQQAYGQQAYGQQYQQQMYGQQQMTPQQYQQQQMQQQQMQQQQMMQQKQREEEQRRQEQQRRAEQQGVMNCQQILQKLTGVTPETIDHIKDEVEKMVMQELPKCGSQAEAVRAEAAQQIQMAQVRVEQVKQQRIEEERLNGERCEFAKKVLAELIALVTQAEQDTAALKTTAAPVLESKIMSEEDARSAGKAVSEVSVAAKASCKACSDFIVERRMNIDSVKPPLLAPLREEQLKIQERIQECYKIVVSSTISAKVMIDKAVKKTAATKTLEKRTSAFEKYNGKREVMTIDEILAYAKGEYAFAFSKEAAAVVAKKYGDGKSVPRVHFQRIKVAVGIAREEEASKARKKEAELKRLALEAKKKAIEADIQKVADVLAEAEPAVAKAEEAGKTEQLSRDYLNATPDKDAVTAAMESASAALKDAQGELGDVRTRLSDLVSSADDDVKQWVTIEIRKVEMKVAAMDARLVQTGQAGERGRHFLQMLEAKELHAAKIEVAKLLRSKKLDVEELFKAADKDGDGVVNLVDFTALIEGCEGCKLSGEKIEQVYNMYNDAGSGSFSKETLFLASRSYYFVAAETVLSSTENLEGETLRRLELKELLEVLEGPVEEASTKISRVRCRAVFDGVEGWVTMAGNNGTEYLMASDGNLEVVREVPLTDALHEGNVLRQLSHGEKLEVLEWDKKNPAEDVRVKVKVKGSTDMGWVTRASADGMQYLKIQ